MALSLRLETPVELQSASPSEVATRTPTRTGLSSVQAPGPGPYDAVLGGPQAYRPSSPGPGPYDAVLGGPQAYRPPPSATVSGPGMPRSVVGPAALEAAGAGRFLGPLSRVARPLALLPPLVQTAKDLGNTGRALGQFINDGGNYDKYLGNRLQHLAAHPEDAYPFELEGLKKAYSKRHPNELPPWAKPIDPTASNDGGYGVAGERYNVTQTTTSKRYNPFSGHHTVTFETGVSGSPFSGPILSVGFEPETSVQSTSSGTGFAYIIAGTPAVKIGTGTFDYSPNSYYESLSIASVTKLDGTPAEAQPQQQENIPSIPATFDQSPSLLSPVPQSLNPQQIPQAPTLQQQKQGTAQPQKLQQPQKLDQPQAQKQPQNLQQPQNYIPPQLVPNLPANYPSLTTPTTTATERAVGGGDNPFPKNYQQIGTPQTQQQQQQQTPQTSPPRCEDPCIASLQQGQEALDDLLSGLGDLLNNLSTSIEDYQAEQQQQQQQNNTPITISVPVVACNLDGTTETEYVDLSVPSLMADAITEQFQSLAAIQTIQCKLERNVERSLNILGGDVWFEDEEDREPEFKTKVERKIKEAGTLFGFPEIAAETPPTTGSNGDNNAQPVAGQLKAKSIIELINAYTSNLYHRAGYQGLPASVPKTLLGYTDGDDPETMKDFASYFVWFVKQVDGLIGKFPINITIEDVDPLTQGNQTKNVELPNISEALAEMYGLNISSSVNGDVAVNFLMRLASEVIATKNSSLITQDYVRANAAFLGYKGNPARREINYSFDAAKLGSLDEFLNESKGYIVGWEEDDKESVVGFLQRIVFSAGIIKAAFFRDKNRLAELQKEIESMMAGDKTASDAEWEAILALINNPEEYFNKDSIPHPRVREKPSPPPPEEPTP